MWTEGEGGPEERVTEETVIHHVLAICSLEDVEKSLNLGGVLG